METGNWIAVDWGSTNFRAYLVDADGKTLESREARDGVLSLGQTGCTNFGAVFDRHCGDWLEESRPQIFIAGMISSNLGWQEVDYVPCPACPDDIAAGIYPLRHRDITVNIIPGLSTIGPSGAHDVLRGEEVQIVGALSQLSGDDRPLLCLPGTHSKWVKPVDNDTHQDSKYGCIDTFSSFLTGEMYGMLSSNSSLASLIDVESHLDEKAFYQGLDHAHRKGNLSHLIFTVRSQAIRENTDRESSASYLSGILIGQEILGAMQLYQQPQKVCLLGSEKLSHLYQLALSRSGIDNFSLNAAEVFVSGMHCIKQARL